MKNIVSAAGYATRLGELTRNFPKPLLQIGESTILGRMLDDIDRIPEIDEHIIITNHRFASIFEEWAAAQHYPLHTSRQKRFALPHARRCWQHVHRYSHARLRADRDNDRNI